MDCKHVLAAGFAPIHWVAGLMWLRGSHALNGLHTLHGWSHYVTGLQVISGCRFALIIWVAVRFRLFAPHYWVAVVDWLRSHPSFGLQARSGCWERIILLGYIQDVAAGSHIYVGLQTDYGCRVRSSFWVANF